MSARSASGEPSAATRTISERGHEASAVDVRDRPDSFTPEEYDAVVVGASIHVGKH
ncbi:flavodoxin domain-containing protein [Haloplanus rubicundus]|uniref:flavodoxin domain-containing protein n=1 Tax=Haloplanus rubicundus TaxID=1547898 RepID=UPI001FEB4EF2|nr:flavodoxin domain-containing protein [Haloplanus rubicundus]